MPFILTFLAGFCTAALLLCTPAQAATPDAPLLPVRAVRALPHDTAAFTQGFLLHDGLFYESTGHYGESELREVQPETGAVLRSRNLDANLFGEGLALVGDNLLQLTWKSGRALLWDIQRFSAAGELRLGREAWGLAATRDQLFLSDGSAQIRMFAPGDLRPLGEFTVVDNARPVAQLNELEIVQDWLLANIWFEDKVAVVSLAGQDQGKVVAWLDLSPLRKLLLQEAGVANGLAWDEANKRLYVTGKNWDRVFELSVPGAPWEARPKR
ncbi:MAG: glutaminyl-peptide cyclotransferase [Desulfovibrionaceae bacterium]